jgi:uncharacterized protein YbjT (DUF2867 family)
VQRLAKAGWRIRVAVRHPNLALFLKPLGDVGQIQIVPCDVSGEKYVAAAVEGAEAVINLVGILYPSGHNDFDGTQAKGPALIARAAALAGVKHLVQISAIGADAESEIPYARTKGMGEAAVRAAFPSAVILRPSVIFGPEDGFFNKFAGLAARLPFLPLIGNAKFQPVYVGDVADAVMAALAKPEAAGHIYELGGPRVYSFRDLLEIVLRETKRKRLILPVPFAVAKMQGAVLGMLPNPMLTSDQVELLKKDNVAHGEGLPALGITATPVEAIVPSYLYRYRKGGQFATAVKV